MKLTTNQLRSLIREEISRVMYDPPETPEVWPLVCIYDLYGNRMEKFTYHDKTVDEVIKMFDSKKRGLTFYRGEEVFGDDFEAATVKRGNVPSMYADTTGSNQYIVIGSVDEAGQEAALEAQATAM